jgi:DNA-binding response OmpR family regulator
MGQATTTGQNPVRLLVVDDIADNRAVLTRYFGDRGFEIDQADSGVAALAKLAQQRFDAVLLDILMPGMDGIEVLKKIRQVHSALDLPVIMVTAKAARMDIVLAMDLGANDYITKPIDFPVAFACVQNHLSRKLGEQQVAASNV